jgi:hypothetical protein
MSLARIWRESKNLSAGLGRSGVHLRTLEPSLGKIGDFSKDAYSSVLLKLTVQLSATRCSLAIGLQVTLNLSLAARTYAGRIAVEGFPEHPWSC